MDLKDRIKQFKRVPASQLRPNPRNWRVHGDDQKNALLGVFGELGICAACLVRELEDDLYEIIDGHLRAELLEAYGSNPVPVLVLDVDEDEAAKLLATFDTLTAMAGVDPKALESLLADATFLSEATSQMLEELAKRSGLHPFGEQGEQADRGAQTLHGATLDDLAPDEEEGKLLAGRRVIVEFSGGKDSSAAAVWAKHFLPDTAIELMFCEMGADWVGFSIFLHDFAAWLGAKLTVLRSPENMIDVFLGKGQWPHFRFPYCHDVLHSTMDAYLLEQPADEIVIVRGGRREEKAAASKARPSRWMTLDRKPQYKYFQPLYFTDKESGERILTEAGAPMWDGYERGLCRTACRICPGQRPAAYAAMRREFPDVWRELLDLESRFGPGAWQGRPGGGSKEVKTFAELADKADEAAQKPKTVPGKRKKKAGTRKRTPARTQKTA